MSADVGRCGDGRCCRPMKPSFYHFVAVLIVAFCLAVAPDCPAQSVHQPTASERESLEEFLQKNWSTRYSAAFVDLQDDGNFEVIVRLTGAQWCGTGGCRTLILVSEGASYRVVTNFLIVWLPIRVLATKSHGWHDISIRVAGGGIQPGYESRLSFNGKSYPVSPVLLRNGKIRKKVPGLVVLADETKGSE